MSLLVDEGERRSYERSWAPCAAWGIWDIEFAHPDWTAQPGSSQQN
jgi:hypothetical protein